MIEALLQNKNILQATLFLFLTAFLLGIETFFSRRSFEYPRFLRVASNLTLALINNLLLYLVFPFMAFGAGFLVAEGNWGLFQKLKWNEGLEIVLGVLLLDLAIYLQHVAFHKVPLLWRVHRVHHADLDLDATTGIRFHPIEILLSMGIKIGFIFILGTGPLTVLIFEMLLMLSSIFNHANINIPISVDRFLRLFVVTPDVHRVHHSVYVTETNSNYGFNFPWWDRIFKTFQSQPQDGHLKMKIGLEVFRSTKWIYLHRVLIEPFVKKKYI